MTPQEREVINSIFERLKAAATQPRDAEAERHIAGLVAQQPYATYALAQSVYVQEQALTNLQAQVEELQGQVAQMQQQAAQQQQSGGFLSGLFGGGARPQPQAAAPRATPWGGAPQGGMPMQRAPQQGGPWGGQPQPGPWGGQAAAPQQGGGFLSSALTTAAGVAGGMVVGNMLMNAFKGDSGHAGQGSQASAQGGTEALPSSQSASQDQAMLDQAEAYDAGYDDGGEDDYGGGGDSYEA